MLHQKIVGLLRNGNRQNFQQLGGQMKPKRTYMVIFVVLGVSLISFMAGRIVEATCYQWEKNESRQNLKEAEQQIAIYKSELSHLRSELSIDPSNDIGTMNWTEALQK